MGNAILFDDSGQNKPSGLGSILITWMQSLLKRMQNNFAYCKSSDSIMTGIALSNKLCLVERLHPIVYR